jgi:hypothetical protein
MGLAEPYAGPPSPAKIERSDIGLILLIYGDGTRRSRNRADQLQSHAEGKFMANLAGLSSFVSKLNAVRTSLVNELRHVDAALSVLGKLGGGGSHTMSASARKRMSLAQKARWAKAKGRAPKRKRTMSASARRKIAAAQRARWAKLKAGKK